MANARRSELKDKDPKYSVFSAAHGYYNRNTGSWEKDEVTRPRPVVTTVVESVIDWKLLLLAFLVGTLLGMRF